LEIKLAMVLGVVVIPDKLLPPTTFRVMASPDAMATVPKLATTTPAFLTCGASKAI
jgi:hypothetical protein